MAPEARILVSQRVHDEVFARLSLHGEVIMNAALEPWSRAELSARLEGASALMGFMTDQIDEADLNAATELKIIACALKGFDNYDVDACTRRGVWLSIVPDLLTEPTAELAIGLAIALARHVRAGDALVRRGEFRGWRAQLYGTGLRGATVAVLGLGKVGRAIIDRLQGFGCAKILGVDPVQVDSRTRHCELEEACALADYVFAAVPLLPATRHLLGADQLRQSKRGQMLINVGRGSVVDESAVAAALGEGVLAGYAADVFEFEDWSLADRPHAIARSLLAAPHTLFTPHLGSAVHGVRLAIEHRAADNIIAALQNGVPGDAINRPDRPLAVHP